MKVFYFSNHIGDIDFNLLVKNVQRKPNPAGQNFHGKLIASLAKGYEVTCFSIVPSAEEGFKRKAGIKGDGIPHYYFYPPKHKILPPAFTMPRKILKLLLDKFPSVKGDEVIVVYDTLNITLARAAKIVSKKLKCPKIAICTDDPYNISEVGEHYIDAVLHYSKDADGYFCLTDGLNSLFNKTDKPHVVHMGIAEDLDVEPIKLDKPYIYYGGALFYKDGTDALLEAYQEASPNCLLVLSGHGPSKKKANEFAEKNNNIVFLGQISKEENCRYQKGAELCINPRLYRKYLDEVSVPSKMIEYLVNAKSIASTLSTPLKKAYGNNIEWLESTPEIAPKQIYDYLKSHLDKNGNLINLKPNLAREDVLASLGFEATCKKFSELVESLPR